MPSWRQARLNAVTDTPTALAASGSGLPRKLSSSDGVRTTTGKASVVLSIRRRGRIKGAFSSGAGDWERLALWDSPEMLSKRMRGL